MRVRCLGDKVSKATLKWFGLVQEKAQSIFGYKLRLELKDRRPEGRAKRDLWMYCCWKRT